MISEIFSSESLAAMSLERLSQLERLVRKTKAEFKKTRGKRKAKTPALARVLKELESCARK